MESVSPPSGKKRKAERSALPLETLCDLQIDNVTEIARKLEQDDLEALMRTSMQSKACWKFGRSLWEIYLAKFRRPDELKVYSLHIWHGNLVSKEVADIDPREEAWDAEVELWRRESDIDFLVEDWRWDFGLAVARDRDRASDLLIEKITEGLDISPRAKVFKIFRNEMIVESHPLSNEIYSEEQLEIDKTDGGEMMSNSGNQGDFEMKHFFAFIDPHASLLEEVKEEEEEEEEDGEDLFD